MPDTHSFDVTTGVDLQEADNAVNQAVKEVGTRYDFKGTTCTVELDRKAAVIRCTADDEFRMKALWDIVETRLIKRGIPVRNLDVGEDAVTGTTVRREITLKTALDSETAKKVAAAIKAAKLKKVQAAIQGEQVRVTSPSRDELQAAIALLRAEDFGVELQYGNFR